jgi:antitoxin YefM
MTRILVMTKTLPLAEIKAHLSEIIDEVEQQHERVILTRNGRPAAVILSLDELEGMEETMDILSDPDALRQIKESEEAIARGEYVTLEELRRQYGL